LKFAAPTLACSIVHADRSAGCRTIFVDYGYPQDRPHEPDKLVHSLREAADFIFGREARR
jgi:hypothetical protein